MHVWRACSSALLSIGCPSLAWTPYCSIAAYVRGANSSTLLTTAGEAPSSQPTARWACRACRWACCAATSHKIAGRGGHISDGLPLLSCEQLPHLLGSTERSRDITDWFGIGWCFDTCLQAAPAPVGSKGVSRCAAVSLAQPGKHATARDNGKGVASHCWPVNSSRTVHGGERRREETRAFGACKPLVAVIGCAVHNPRLGCRRDTPVCLPLTARPLRACAGTRPASWSRWPCTTTRWRQQVVQKCLKSSKNWAPSLGHAGSAQQQCGGSKVVNV